MFIDMMFNAWTPPIVGNVENIPPGANQIPKVARATTGDSAESAVLKQNVSILGVTLARSPFCGVSADISYRNKIYPSFVVDELTPQQMKDLSALMVAFPAAVIPKKPAATFKTEPSFDGPYRQALKKRLPTAQKTRLRLRRCICPECCRAYDAERRARLRDRAIAAHRERVQERIRAANQEAAEARMRKMLNKDLAKDPIEEKFKDLIMEGNAYTFPNSWPEYFRRLGAFRMACKYYPEEKPSLTSKTFFACLSYGEDSEVVEAEYQLEEEESSTSSTPIRQRRKKRSTYERCDEAQAREEGEVCEPNEIVRNYILRNFLRKVRTEVAIRRPVLTSDDKVLAALEFQELITRLASDYKSLTKSCGRDDLPYNSRSSIAKTINDHLNYISYE